MLAKIEIAQRPELKDALGEKTYRRIKEDLGLNIEGLRTIRVYLLEADVSFQEVKSFAQEALYDPITQILAVDQPLASFFSFDWLIQIGFKPGVTDNEGKVAREALEIFLGRSLREEEGIYSLMQYLIKGNITKKQAERVARELLANELIERWWIVSFSEFDKEKGLEISPPKVTEEVDIRIETFALSFMDEKSLELLSKERLLALNLKEMLTIKEFFSNKDFISFREKYGLGAEITDVELECLAQTWSEHCKHKIFNAQITYIDKVSQKKEIINSLFKTYIQGATEKIRKDKGQDDFCLSVFIDNAGVIKLNENWNVAFKVETHNSPSALDPYGGALTGIVGVNRDPFGTGKGSLLIFNTDVFCFAPPYWERPLPPRLLHPKRVFEGVREGVEHGGNKSGIPTVNGSLVFDPRYLGKPLVFCGTGGLLPSEICQEPSWKKRACPGDLVVMVGGRIGKDGIHGATFSSEELHEGSPVTAVQIGDPITQKKMTDFLLLARDECLYNSITDNGAGGLSSSVGEMARESGGAEIDLEKAPLKYHGLQPWEILLSESQERMTVAVPKEKINRFLNLAKKMDVEATVIGCFTDSGYFHIRYQGKTVGLLPLNFLHEGVPQLELKAIWDPPQLKDPSFPEPEDLGLILHQLLSRFNICSKEYVVRQYDHEVQGGSVIKPLTGVMDDGPSDAAVLRPDLDRLDGLVVSHGICPKFSDIDTYWMVANAIDEAIRNAVCVGGDLEHMAGLDNFCWCDPIKSEKTPDGDFKLAQLVRANKALYDMTTVFGVPCISGKDSMKNDYLAKDVNISQEKNPFGVGQVLPDGSLKISIPPTLLFSVLARIPDVRKAVTMDVKRPGDLVYILGMTKEELGGSEYFAYHGFLGQSVPKVDPWSARERYLLLKEAIFYGLIASAHDCSDGGLGVCLAEKCFAGGWGMYINLSSVPYEGTKRWDFILFSETPSRIVVTVPREKQKDFEKLFSNTIYALIGEVIADPLLIIKDDRGFILLEENIYDLKKIWKSPLDW